ncbi:MAG TPA: tripartite tricarboxylate transporter substrate-binding protein, partial [Myxococcaceae bacterium]|nr:tripartite tricarboxylate transporter substrate-binding protein [Myxococcaceae bacterium]
ALLSPRRVKTLPELPVIAETVPGVSSLSIVGLVAPRATPRELVRRISADVAKALRSPDLNARMTEVGMEPVGSTPEQFDAFIRSEIERWSAMVKTSGAKIE